MVEDSDKLVIPDPGETNHVYPTNDMFPHSFNGTTCWCFPVWTVCEQGMPMIVHNAFDARYEDLPNGDTAKWH